MLDGQSASAMYIDYEGNLGSLWTVVVRRWDAARTVWAGIATCGQIAATADDAVRLVRRNGPWPEGAEFIPYAPGHPVGAIVWGTP